MCIYIKDVLGKTTVYPSPYYVDYDCSQMHDAN